ncbi:hypothetical protein [Lewinella sp. W8]|uniref:hypothetical protein n=1 Tax=Lewinella sp. W8 TaxID=2528208 RepID=UPI001068834D|nr:hypothetical protein [Lewinella sp. W8]MTB53036.1 hypothetical protein [Lewinella sp. W8]
MEELIEAVVGLTTTDPGQFITGLKGEDGRLSEDAVEKVKGVLVEHIKSVGKQQLGRGVKTKARELENLVREKLGNGYDLDPSLQESQLIEALATAWNSEREKLSAGAKKIEGEGLTLEKLLEREDVRERVASKVKTATQTLEQKLAQLEEGYKSKLQELIHKNRSSQLAAAIDQIASKFSFSVDVDGDKSLSERRRNLLRNLIGVEEVAEAEDGKLYPVDKEGNAMYHPETMQKMTLVDLVRSRNPFGESEFPKGAKSTPKPKNGKPVAGAKYYFENAEAYMDARSKTSDLTKRREMAEAWSAQQQQES